MEMHASEKTPVYQPPSELDLKEVIDLVKTEWKPSKDPGFEMRNSSVFWERVFLLFHAEYPKNDKDPRWDDLLSRGFRVFPLHENRL